MEIIGKINRCECNDSDQCKTDRKQKTVDELITGGIAERNKALEKAAIMAESLHEYTDLANQVGAGAKNRDTCTPMWRLLPFQALDIIAGVLTKGAEKYGDRDWEKGLPLTICIDHAMIHIAKFVLSATTASVSFNGGEMEKEDHLAHAACNLLMALETRERVDQELLPKELVKL